MHFLDQLNEPQKQASTHIDGPLSIIAGAGSGKTKVLTTRIAFLMEQGIEPYNILALTFTNKAAKEMIERVEKMVGNASARSLFIGTFHSVFSKILRVEADKLGYPNNFTIYDSDDSKNLIKKVIKDMGLDEKVYKPNVVQYRISAAKNALITPKLYAETPELISEDQSSNLRELVHIYKKYYDECFKNGAMDFDDLLLKMYELLVRFPEVLSKYQHKFHYIMIDEYQDTNATQYHIVKLLAALRENIVIVGDDAQSIYSFRGATIKNIMQFQTDYPESKTIKLEQNYRSSQTIINAANKIIENNKYQIKKNLWTQNEVGDKIKLYKLLTENEEGKYIADTIAEEKLRNHLSNQDFVILYRTNAQSRAFEESLRRKNIAYRIYGGTSFYSRKEIKDFITYLRILVNSRDEEAVKRIINFPVRGIGLTSIQKLVLYADHNNIPLWDVLQNPEKTGVATGACNSIRQFVTMIESVRIFLDKKNAYEIAKEIGKQSGLLAHFNSDLTVEGQSRKENVDELLNSIQEYSEEVDENGEVIFKPLGEYLQQITLLTDADNEVEQQDTVKLMTIHASKGLEFPNVFLVGMEENLFPSTRSMYDMDDLEEERRLFYVAITRAKQKLWITYTNMRYRFGNLINNMPSRFLDELPQDMVEKNSLSNSEMSSKHSISSSSNLVNSIRKTSPSSFIHQASSNFQAEDVSTLILGDKVEHVKFGFGKITLLEGNENNKMATIQFEKESTPKKIMLKFAKLRKV